jgi:hypothetical protein
MGKRLATFRGKFRDKASGNFLCACEHNKASLQFEGRGLLQCCRSSEYESCVTDSDGHHVPRAVNRNSNVRLRKTLILCYDGTMRR